VLGFLMEVIPAEVRSVIERLFEKAPKVCIIGTGSGGALFGWLLAIPGCSSTILNIEVPYSMAASAELLPEISQFCAMNVAVDLSKKAYEKAAKLMMLEACSSGRHDSCIRELGGHRVIGLGLTAAVASSRPKRGKHRCFIASYTPEQGTVTYELELYKGEIGVDGLPVNPVRDRAGEDQVVSRLALRALAFAADIEIPAAFLDEVLCLEGGQEVIPVPTPMDDRDVLGQLYNPAGSVSSVLQVPVMATAVETARFGDIHMFPKETLIYPGSFNPPHSGHFGFARKAQDFCQQYFQQTPSVVFEITFKNADKPPIAKEELERRLMLGVTETLEGSWNVVATKASLFIDKARLFPNCTFLIGADTLERLLDVKYYNNSELEMVSALTEINVLGCKFIVAGRIKGDSFVTGDTILSAANLPPKIHRMFFNFSEVDFRDDNSSTALREAEKRKIVG